MFSSVRSPRTLVAVACMRHAQSRSTDFACVVAAVATLVTQGRKVTALGGRLQEGQRLGCGLALPRAAGATSPSAQSKGATLLFFIDGVEVVSVPLTSAATL